MQSLQSLRDWASVPEAWRSTLLQSAVSSVAVALAQGCSELLDNVAKTQASLSKFRRNAVGSGAADGAGTSLTKVQKQLRLDVAEFGQHIRRLVGCEAASIEAYAQLQRTVQAEGDGVDAQPEAATQTAGARDSTRQISEAAGNVDGQTGAEVHEAADADLLSGSGGRHAAGATTNGRR